MKKGIHPEYREVVFHDTQSDHKFITRSTVKSDEKIKMEDGKEYPLIKVEVSSVELRNLTRDIRNKYLIQIHKKSPS